MGQAHEPVVAPPSAEANGTESAEAATRTKPKRILLMWSATGGGHRASAEALKAGFQNMYGDAYLVDSVDMWSEHMAWPVNQMHKAYNIMVKHSWLWRCVFNAPEELHHMNCEMNANMSYSRLKEAFDVLQPDLVVSVHPAMQHVPLKVLKQRAKRSPDTKRPAFATVITDLSDGCHHLWYHKDVDHLYVPIQDVAEVAYRRGLRHDQVKVFGLPVRPAFSDERPPKGELRKALGLDPTARVALLVGGGEGMGPVEATVKAIAKSGCACQLVVICGKNASLAKKLEAGSWGPSLNLVVQGFVTNMEQWMSASDCIITKAGPGTIAEALICGLPILLNAFIPCQEEGNIPFVQNARVGDYKEKPEEIAATLKKWFSGDYAGELQAMSDRAKALSKPDALTDICRSLAELLTNRQTPPPAAATQA